MVKLNVIHNRVRAVPEHPQLSATEEIWKLEIDCS